SAARGRFMRLYFNSLPLYQPGRLFYFRDNKDGDYWSSSWMPVRKDLTRFKYECRHGTAYTRISSEYKGIATEATYFVPLDRWFEVWLMKVTNRSSEKKELS